MDTPVPESPETGNDDTASTGAASDERLEETFVPGEADTGDLTEMAAPAVSKTDPAESSPPKKSKASRLGDFKLLKKLGEGGMGEVYLAHQAGLDRKVALKVLSKELGKKQAFVERFFREARAMAKLDHPHVLKVYAIDSDKGRHYVAIEFIDGQSMQDWMDERGQVEVGDAVHVTLRCAEALLHAHEATLIHRDIKPDNILVTSKGVVKVADFGLAKAVDEDVSMTQSGTGLGTPLYMAPEQARNAKDVDQRADIYSLGCTLYYLVTGQLPFSGSTALELIMAKEKGQFTSARKLNKSVPDRLDLVIDRMMAKDVAHRYESCAQVISDLESLKLASDSLAFIGGEAVATPTRPRADSSPTSKTPGSLPAVSLPTTSSEDAERTATKKKSLAADEAEWFIQHTNAKKRTVVTRMSTEQVRKAIAGKLLDLKARAKQSQSDSFLPLAQFPEFEKAMQQRIARAKSDQQGSGLKQIYKKLDEQDRRRKRWRFVSYHARGLMGWIGLVVMLAVLILIGLGLWWVFDASMLPTLKSWFGGE